MAKRLRGWQLEHESGRKAKVKPGKALEKAEGPVAESALANKLLHLWAKGTLSATWLREFADCAIQDGASNDDLVALAQTGNWGAQPGNCHKQILNHFCANVKICEGYEVEVPWKRQPFSYPTLCSSSLVNTTQRFSFICLALEKATWLTSGKEWQSQGMTNWWATP